MFEWMLNNTRTLFPEKSSLFFSLIFPIMMVFVLGNMLSELDNPDTPIGTIRIAYCIEEEDPVKAEYDEYEYESVAANMGRIAEATAVRAFTDALADNDNIETVKVSDLDAARAEVDSGRADAAMIFETPLRISIAEGKDIYKNRAVNLIAQSFARSYAAFKAAAIHNPAIYMEIAEKGMSDFPGLTADKDLGVKRSMMDFYAVTMIVMIAFMGGGIGGASEMFFGRQNGSLRRATASTRSRARMFIETVLGVIPQNIMQTLIVMVPAALFLGAHYAKTWQENLLLFAFFILLGVAVSAVFMLIGLFVRSNPYMPIMALLWSLLFLSGTFSKDMSIKGFSEFLPMNIAQRAAFDLTMFGRPEQLLSMMGVCAIIILASCLLGSVLFKRKEIML